MKTRTYTIKTRSGLHCGIGQGLSDIDLPTAKEPVSGYPFIPGTSLKGVLRDYFDDSSALFITAFGQGSADRIDFAAALSFTDARLICLPLRAYFGTFAYAASPYSLGLLKRILQEDEMTGLPELPAYPSMDETDTFRASVPTDSALRLGGHLGNRLLLEDLDLLVDEKSTELADKWADLLAPLVCGNEDTEGQQVFKKHFAITDDNVLAFFCETGLPVDTHTRIGENGVVEDKALWYEEFVPPEAIFSGTIYAENSRNDKSRHLSDDQLLGFVCHGPINCQVGGNTTTGRGLISITFNPKNQGGAS